MNNDPLPETALAGAAQYSDPQLGLRASPGSKHTDLQQQIQSLDGVIDLLVELRDMITAVNGIRGDVAKNPQPSEVWSLEQMLNVAPSEIGMRREQMQILINEIRQALF